MKEIVKVKRVCYGKTSTPAHLREYTIVDSGSSAVGTLLEIKKFLEENGVNADIDIVR